ncbi:EPM2AIP1 [Cordylochernes scorpioides]|uniref:EPM2AIP1 n=1 Tax=Cordylochernes scorpioides TaxID=51811 RepID=A0ABY6LLZ7_9ARAC|nr:EPM2AIP1 [Cordylochernes scorpioides]
MEKKRKIDSECRKFKDQWNIQYFVIESSNKALCLICNESIAVLKEYNMKRHYETKHSQNYSKYTGIVRTEKFEALKRGLKSQQSLFTKVKTEQEAATRASFRVALEIAKRGKPFTDGEMIKECIIAVVEEMCPEKVLIYIRGVDKSYEVHEELLDMYCIHGTTTGTDIFKGVEMAINKKNLRWKNLKCITTDGGKNMSGKDKGVVALVSKAVENDGGSKPLVLHCIIHQQSLCGKCLDMSDVLKPVISTVNFIRSFGLNHRQFRQFIAEIGETDLPYHTAVRWLSCGKVLQRFFELRAVIEIFLNEKHRPLTELQNNAWLWKLAFYVDLTKHVNELNLRLQGENQHLPDLYTNIKSFRMKLILFQSQLRSKCFSHFKTCEIFSHTTETEFPIDFAIETLSALKINFDTRFSDFDAIANQIKIFQNPFDADIETLAPELQMEMIDLQCSDIIKNKYENSSLLEFYKSLPLTQFDNLHKFARGLFSVFGTTYLCEKTFSKMKYTKNVYRSKLTDEHIKSLLIIGSLNDNGLFANKVVLVNKSFIIEEFYGPINSKIHRPEFSRRVNPYTSAYRQMFRVEKDLEQRARIENQQMYQVQMLIQQNHCRDLRQYNASSFNPGWTIGLSQKENRRTRTRSHVTMLQFYSYREEDKPKDRDVIDKLVCAKIPSPTMQVQLYDMVRKHMIHGPCENFNLRSPCKSDGKCTKVFPKSFLQLTEANNNGYPRYRRRDDGQTLVVGTHQVDNRWVVPYNPYLLVRFTAHINVEVCASVKSFKYLFKYVYKGPDRAEVEVTVGESALESRTQNEIKSFLDARYVSAPEAMCRMFEYRLHAHSHTICRLAVHIPNFSLYILLKVAKNRLLKMFHADAQL